MVNLTEITLPQLFELDDLEVIHTLKYSKDENVGLLIAGEYANRINYTNPTIRLYLLNQIKGSFEVTKELDAFSFKTKKEALTFADELPHMSAIDLILKLNSINK